MVTRVAKLKLSRCLGFLIMRLRNGLISVFCGNRHTDLIFMDRLELYGALLQDFLAVDIAGEIFIGHLKPKPYRMVVIIVYAKILVPIKNGAVCPQLRVAFFVMIQINGVI